SNAAERSHVRQEHGHAGCHRAQAANGNLRVPDRHGRADAGARRGDGRHLGPDRLDLSGDQRSAGTSSKMRRQNEACGDMRRVMAAAPDSGEVDRRNFINGRWGAGAGPAEATAEIASVLVQARPERLDAVVQAIEALAGTEIFSRDPKGKLVVVIE